jgi:hypothetical protein
VASAFRNRRSTQARKASSVKRKTRSPSPSKTKAMETRRGGGKPKAITRVKQPAKAPRQSKAASGGERPHKEIRPRGKSRTANLQDRIAPGGRYPENDYVAELLSDIRDEIKGLRGDLQFLRDECRGAKGGAAEVNLFESDPRGTRPRFLRKQSARPPDERRNDEAAEDANPSYSYGSSPRQPRLKQGPVVGEQDSGVPGDDPPRERQVLADYKLLEQSLGFADSDSKKKQSVSRSSVETLLVKMLRSDAYPAAERPTEFTGARLKGALDDRTYRAARAWLRDNGYITARTHKRTKQMNQMHGGKEQEQEYWTDVLLTEQGVALARHIDGLGLPYLKHMGADANKAEAMGTAIGSVDRPKDKP